MPSRDVCSKGSEEFDLTNDLFASVFCPVLLDSVAQRATIDR